MRFKWLRNALGLAMLVLAMAYSTLALIGSPATASAASCCAIELLAG